SKLRSCLTRGVVVQRRSRDWPRGPEDADTGHAQLYTSRTGRADRGGARPEHAQLHAPGTHRLGGARVGGRAGASREHGPDRVGTDEARDLIGREIRRQRPVRYPETNRRPGTREISLRLTERPAPRGSSGLIAAVLASG